MGSPHLPCVCCPLLVGLAQNPFVPSFPERTTQAGKTRSRWVDWPANGTGTYMSLPRRGPTKTWRPEPPSTTTPPPRKEDHWGRSQTGRETDSVVSTHWLCIRTQERKVFKNRDGAQAPLQTNSQIPGGCAQASICTESRRLRPSFSRSRTSGPSGRLAPCMN